MDFDEAMRQIRKKNTSGPNYGVSVESVVDVLTDWSRRFQLEVIEVGPDRLEVELRSLPPDVEAFCREMVAFCPDVLDQGFGAAAEMMDDAPELAELAAGLDPTDRNFGLRLMARDLSRRRRLVLWWD